MPPRVAALPEFWYAKVLRGLRFRAHAVGQASDLLLVAWLTDQDWLADVPRAIGSGPNATRYEYATFPSELPRGSAVRPLAKGTHLDLVPVSAEAARAKGGVWAALAKVALHHRVHMGATVRALGGVRPQPAHRVQAEHSRVARERTAGWPLVLPHAVPWTHYLHRVHVVHSTEYTHHGGPITHKVIEFIFNSCLPKQCAMP